MRTRNARLAAIHSLFQFAALRHPEHAALIATGPRDPTKRFDQALITFLTDRRDRRAPRRAATASTRTGRRDHALLLLAVQTGLRVSELVGLTCADVHLGTGAHVQLPRQRPQSTASPRSPSQTVAGAASSGSTSARPARRAALPDPHRAARSAATRSNACVTKHADRRAGLHAKPITPHVLRHTAAMRLLHAGVDTTVIALWLGHEQAETTQIYLHADMTIKQRALDRTTPPDTKPGRYQPTDQSSPSSKDFEPPGATRIMPRSPRQKPCTATTSAQNAA